MMISAGGYVFDAGTTTVREHYESVGGKETRLITITGLIRGAADREALDAALDGIMAAVSREAPVYVSVRHGRRMRARREAFTREVHARHVTGQFSVALRAETPWEEAEAAANQVWSIGQSGAALAVVAGGNIETRPVISLTASGDIVAPAVGDGARTLRYGGFVESGASLVVDSEAGRVWLDGDDITPYTEGEFPRLQPGGTTLTYTDDPASSHLLAGTVAWRDRWW